MSDIRSLLDDAATGPRPHPAPVEAVHARVRHRTARRRAAAAAGTSFAVAATGALVATRQSPRSSVTPVASTSPSASTAANDAAWRQVFRGPHQPEHKVEFARLTDLVRAHPDVFLALTVQGKEDYPDWTVAVSVGSDVDPEAWRAKVSEAAGTMPWTFKQCQRPTSHYDAIAQRLTAMQWPSGATIRSLDAHAVTYTARCQIYVALTGTLIDPRDTEYAAKHFGDDVEVYVKPAPATTAPSPNSDGTLG